MNNEPVAWGMTWKDGEIYDVISPAQHAKEEGDYTIPLYAHPVKEELTDEEIADLIANKVTDSEMIKQALRKVQGDV